ncbi:MAG TPA: acyl-CoA dehydrogenase family protein [Acidimicrobiales bacterium]|nr:acyl-CoA dehydrogenase family protein [Acidimicrobiales bacterium]
MDGADLELFERSLRHATGNHTGAALDAALEELGWRDALDVDPRAAVSLLFELQGAANAASSALGHVVLGAIGVEHGPGGVVLPAPGRWAPPGELRDDRLAVAGLGTAALAAQERALVVARSDGKDVALVVPTAELALRPVEGIDPWLGLVQVTGDPIAVDTAPQPVPGWTAAVALAQVALGHELVGAARTMLDLAREHALERVQFGQPISRFQAVRHRLAETLVAIETAGAVLDAAWLDRAPGTAAMAKALAGRGARTAARHCQQVLAGIGFTTEHVLHRYVRRVLVLDELFGAARTLTRAQGDELLTSRTLPALLPL